MIEDSIRKIIDTTLKKVDLYSQSAADLIFETGKAESGFYQIEQMGNGPAKGFFQCEPATMHDCVDNFIKFRPELEKAMYSLGYIDEDPEFSLLTNIALQVFFCRIKYRRDKDPIPKTIRERADYWKRVYNTEGGKGTVQHYMKANNPFS